MPIRNHFKIAVWAIVLLLAALTVTACGSRDSGSQGSVPVSSPAAETPGSSENSNSQQEGPIWLTGTYNGLADGHTVEIQTPDGAQAYQISHEIFKKVLTWESGAKVKYKVEENKITELDLE